MAEFFGSPAVVVLLSFCCVALLYALFALGLFRFSQAGFLKAHLLPQNYLL